MDPVLGENKPHPYKPVCENHDEYCAVCLKDENDPIHFITVKKFDVAFVEFCNRKSEEYLNKCKEIKKKKPYSWAFDKEWEVMWYRASYYSEKAKKEIG